jgi:hypothetical protein
LAAERPRQPEGFPCSFLVFPVIRLVFTIDCVPWRGLQGVENSRQYDRDGQGENEQNRCHFSAILFREVQSS